MSACPELHFYRAGRQSEWDIHVLPRQSFAKNLLPDILRIAQSGILSFNRTVTCESSTRHRRFPGSKRAQLHSSNTVAAKFTGSEPCRL